MFFELAYLQQLKICFLFMHADGESSPSEIKHLKFILEKKKLSDSAKQEFQTFCEQMTPRIATANSKIIIEEIDRLLGDRQTGLQQILSFVSGNIDGNKLLQAQTIWTLINLGYADSAYSEAEKEVVNHLIKRWEMDPLSVSELNDTADTILALTLQKEWVQSTSRPRTEINGIVQELDRNIAAMFANVETSISEVYIT